MRKLLFLAIVLSVSAASCTTLPAPKYAAYSLPRKNVYIDGTDRPYKTVGYVRTKVNFGTLDSGHDENELCRNYYNKAVRDLLARAKEKGADAIVDVKSVVFFEDGSQETYKTPECADDGQEGQILAQAAAVKWTGPAPNGKLSTPFGDAVIVKKRSKAAAEKKPIPVPAPTPDLKIRDVEEAGHGSSGAAVSPVSPFASPLQQ